MCTLIDKMHFIPFFSFLFILIFCPFLSAEEQTLSYGGFVDTQYAFDLNAPSQGDRSYTTQAARHNEFNINLAYFDLNYTSSRIRSRLALQGGTSVQVNYAGEPNNGKVSGAELSQHFQEARIGYKINDTTWIDAGIFFSHVGGESWLPRDNLTLTRSLVADYSPYYLSGVKITNQATERLQLLLLVTNGWQNVSENNQDKNLGTGIEYSFDTFRVAYNAMFGNEVSPPSGSIPSQSGFRHFHNIIIRSRNLDNWDWLLQFDQGFQKKASSQWSHWYGAVAIARFRWSDDQKISTRLEFYNDPDQVIITTGNPFSFNGYGGSIGWDQTLDKNVLWRIEVRYLKTSHSVFPKKTNLFENSDTVFVNSLSISF